MSTANRLLDAYDRGDLSRRELLAGLAALGAAGGALVHSAAAQNDGQPAATFVATDVDHVALHVTDIARSRDFYVRHLGLKVARESARSAFLHCGEEFLALFKAERAGLAHYCFSIRGYEPEAAIEKLKAAGLAGRREGNRVYFDDPDGLVVQVSR